MMKLKFLVFICCVLVSCRRDTEIEKEYYQNGRIKSESERKNGILNGHFAEYYFSGKKKTSGNRLNGEFHGLIEHFYESGQLKSRGEWYMGKENGPALAYFENGVLQFSANFVIGKTIGVSKVFYDDGSIRERKIYDSLGNMIHISTFEKDGSLNKSFVVPYVNAFKDTVSIAEEVTINIRFPYKMKGDIFIRSSETDPNGDVLRHDEVFRCNSSDSILVKHTFMISGSNKITFEFDHENFQPGDTLNVKNVGRDCIIMVLKSGNVGKS